MTDLVTVRREDLEALIERALGRTPWIHELDALIAELRAAVGEDVLPPLTKAQYKAGYESWLNTVCPADEEEWCPTLWEALRAAATKEDE